MVKKQNIKAELKIVLLANDMDIAESSDPILWQKVLAVINTQTEGSKNDNIGDFRQNDTNDLSSARGNTEKMSQEIGVSVAILKGACNPSDSAPFIYLDKHHWEAMKKGTPPRGPKSIAPIALAATLLILWKEKSKLGDSTISDAQKVLGTLNLYDKHTKRSLDNCEWLQLRGKNIIINPAQTSKAIKMAKAYCTKEWSS